MEVEGHFPFHCLVFLYPACSPTPVTVEAKEYVVLTGVLVACVHVLGPVYKEIGSPQYWHVSSFF